MSVCLCHNVHYNYNKHNQINTTKTDKLHFVLVVSYIKARQIFISDRRYRFWKIFVFRVTYERHNKRNMNVVKICDKAFRP